MKKESRIVLFDRDSLSSYSHVFEIPIGKEITVTAIGLHNNDYVHFELVDAPGVKPCDCSCPPPKVEAPKVRAREVIKYENRPVLLTSANPVVVIGVPQGFPMRAVLHIHDEADRENVFVAMRITQSIWVPIVYQGLAVQSVDEDVDDSIGAPKPRRPRRPRHHRPWFPYYDPDDDGDGDDDGDDGDDDGDEDTGDIDTEPGPVEGSGVDGHVE